MVVVVLVVVVVVVVVVVEGATGGANPSFGRIIRMKKGMVFTEKVVERKNEINRRKETMNIPLCKETTVLAFRPKIINQVRVH